MNVHKSYYTHKHYHHQSADTSAFPSNNLKAAVFDLSSDKKNSTREAVKL